MASRVAITGIGVIAPGAIGIGEFREMLARGEGAVADIDRFDTAGLSAHRAALVRGFNPRTYIAPMKLRRMNVLSRLAVSAAKLALEDAAPIDPSTAGVSLGTAFGPVQTSIDYLSEYFEKGPSLAPPQLFAESVANAPASHMAIEWKLRGFNVTVTQRESSALAAAMYAAAQILKGAASSALIGGVEEVSEMLFSVFDRIGALAHGEGEAARPFDARRNGIVLGEGAAILVASGSPSGRVYGHLSGFGISRDRTASLSDWGSDHGAVIRAMQGAVADAGLQPSEIDAVYASANSSVRGDRLEYRAIQELFETRIPVVAVKGYFGEYAAAGGLQLAAALVALDEQALHASAGFESGEPEMRLDMVRERRPAVLRHILVNSLSAGGGVVSAIVSREAA